jgi:hypothetical protein
MVRTVILFGFFSLGSVTALAYVSFGGCFVGVELSQDTCNIQELRELQESLPIH